MLMKHKKILKKAIALLCTTAIFVGGLHGLATESDASTGTPIIPIELEGYTRVTPESFGITSEVVHTYADANIEQNYYVQNTTDFSKAYLDMDISLTVTDINSGFGYLNPYLIRVYITGSALTVYSLQGGTLMYQTEMSELGIAEGEYFNLKLATDLSEGADTANTDVRVQMWVNNRWVEPKDDTITVPDEYIGSWLNVTLIQEGTIKITAPTEFTEIETPEEPDPPLTPQVPEELNSYTKVTPESFGITSETVHTHTGTYVDQNYYIQNTTNFDKAYLDADVSLTETDINSGLGYLNPYLIRVYITGSTLAVYSLQGETLMYQTELSELKIEAGEYFNLKLATDFSVSENAGNTDVKVQMWVNNTLVTPKDDTVTVPDAYIGSWLNVTLAQAGTIKITAPTEFTGEPDEPEEPEKPDEPVVPMIPDIPVELEGYTKVTPESFGITSEAVLTHAGANIDQSYYVQNTTDFDRAYLDADISLTSTDINSGFGYLNPYLIRVYITGSALTVYSLQGGTLMYQTEMSELGIAAGEYFNLKLATDISEGQDSANADVKVQMWVNNKLVTPIDDTVTVPDAYIGSWLNVTLTQEGTIKITAPTEFMKELIVTEVVSGLEIPEELAGYTMVTPSNFGVTEEIIHTTIDSTGAGTSKWVENITDFNKKFFNADIALTDTQATNISGGFGYLNQYLFRFYISGTTLVVYSIEGGYKTMYQAELAAYEIEAGEYFNLKFATDITDNATDSAKSDVKVQMWLNNTLVTPLVDTVTVGDAYVGNFINVTLMEEGAIKIKPHTDYIVSYSNISEYRSNGNTTPEAPKGYVFAGWYSAPECNREAAIATDYKEGPAYAKFVDKNILTVKAQLSAGTNAESQTTNMRFVTSVNDLNYRKIGFKIIIHKSTGDDVRDRVDNVVYKKLTAMIGDEAWNYSPQQLFGGTATYFKAWVIRNITKDDFNTEFDVTPYWETLDGTVVEGKMETKTVSQGISK